MSALQTETAAEWLHASEEFIGTPENVADWMQSCRTDRQNSAFFGPISNAELWKMLMCLTYDGNSISSIQREQARRELYMRIQTEFCGLIALEADKARQYSAVAGREVRA